MLRHCALLILLLAAACAAAQAPAASPPAAPQTPPLLAEEVYKNVQVFKGKEAVRLLPAMLALRGLLGVECSHCHTPMEWEKDTKPEKQKARAHFDMVRFVNNSSVLGGQNLVSCWTCHHGQAKPAALEPDPEAVKRVAATIAVPEADQNKPAEQVFSNIQVLKGVPAGRLPTIMTFFSRSLGVRCDYCHLAGAFERDDQDEKLKAREMLKMVRATLEKFYGGNGPVSCYGCHHGSPHPELEPGKPAPAGHIH